MDYLRYDELPDLQRPTFIAAFRGWNDAGEAATMAVRYVVESLSAHPFAAVEPEEFFDFTVARPRIFVGPDERRDMEWPSNRLFFHQSEKVGEDLVLLLGTEPHLKWRTFASVLVELFQRLGGARLVTLGGLVADSVHTRRPPVTGFTNESELAPHLEALGVTRTRYEGPTGIVGVLNDACRRSGVAALSLWVSVPPYLGGTANPKAALTLLENIERLLHLGLNLATLAGRSRSFENQVNAAIAGSEEVRAYVAELERRLDAGRGPPSADEPDLPPAGEIIGDLEDFLRHQRGEN